MAKQSKPDGFAAFMGELSSRTQAAVVARQGGAAVEPPVNVETGASEYEQMVGQMAPALRDRLTAPPPPDAPKAVPMRYGLVESPNGEWSYTRLFKSPEDLARRIQALEGQDVVVQAFFGVPLPLTKGRQRYIAMPDGRMLKVPLFPGAPCEYVEASTVSTAEIEERGFLGPPELAESVPVAPQVPVGAPDGADEEEEEDDP